jgi:hypothetical protein
LSNIAQYMDEASCPPELPAQLLLPAASLPAAAAAASQMAPAFTLAEVGAGGLQQPRQQKHKVMGLLLV